MQCTWANSQQVCKKNKKGPYGSISTTDFSSCSAHGALCPCEWQDFFIVAVCRNSPKENSILAWLFSDRITGLLSVSINRRELMHLHTQDGDQDNMSNGWQGSHRSALATCWLLSCSPGGSGRAPTLDKCPEHSHALQHRDLLGHLSLWMKQVTEEFVSQNHWGFAFVSYPLQKSLRSCCYFLSGCIPGEISLGVVRFLQKGSAVCAAPVLPPSPQYLALFLFPPSP